MTAPPPLQDMPVPTEVPSPTSIPGDEEAGAPKSCGQAQDFSGLAKRTPIHCSIDYPPNGYWAPKCSEHDLI